MCESNSNMERIPSLELLEKSGCRLTDRHLITKDGMQYNPSIVNPEVMSDDMRKLFNSQKSHIPIDLKDVAYPVKPKKEEPQSVKKFCFQCDTMKDQKEFKRRSVRNSDCKDTCLECEKKARDVAVKAVIKSRSGEPITVEQVKAYVLEAYEIGKNEGAEHDTAKTA